MRNLCLSFALLAGACLMSACAQSRPRTDGVSSETHFLRSCTSDSCGKGLSCVCGACTKACEASSTCTALAKDAVCAAPADDTCDQGRSCDMTCKVKADCTSLGAAYACEDGRCRAPAAVAKPGTGDAGHAPACSGAGCVDSGTIDSTSCRLDKVITALWSPSTDCGMLPVGATTAARTAALDCVRNALDGKSPFRLTWQEQGTDSLLEAGFVGVKQQDGALVVRSLSYDSLSVDGGQANWSQCATFSLQNSCSGDLNTCFQCRATTTAQLCSCYEHRSTGAAVTIECPDTQPDGGAVSRPTACAANTCEFDGVCYPSGTQSEDGCCSCDAQGGSCIEPGWCPGWVLISKRCTTDADCRVQPSTDSGLHCRTDFYGSRGVCTRDCNFGCPTGTECVAEAPDNDGGTVKNVCLRPCTAQADCAIEVQGSPLGSECDATGDLSDGHCF